jgi:hypothetical protein
LAGFLPTVLAGFLRTVLAGFHRTVGVSFNRIQVETNRFTSYCYLPGLVYPLKTYLDLKSSKIPC